MTGKPSSPWLNCSDVIHTHVFARYPLTNFRFHSCCNGTFTHLTSNDRSCKGTCIKYTTNKKKHLRAVKKILQKQANQDKQANPVLATKVEEILICPLVLDTDLWLFQVIKQINLAIYKCLFPDITKVQTAFHVPLLKPYVENHFPGWNTPFLPPSIIP